MISFLFFLIRCVTWKCWFSYNHYDRCDNIIPLIRLMMIDNIQEAAISKCVTPPLYVNLQCISKGFSSGIALQESWQTWWLSNIQRNVENKIWNMKYTNKISPLNVLLNKWLTAIRCQKLLMSLYNHMDTLTHSSIGFYVNLFCRECKNNF